MTDNSDKYDQLYEVYILLLKTVSIIRRLRDYELYQLGFKSGFTGAAHFIATHGNGITISQLASLGSLAPHTVTEVINRMYKAGLVNKKRDSKDRRVVRVELTELGRKTYIEGTSYRQVIHNIIGSLATEELKQFQSYLERLGSKARGFEKEIKAQQNKSHDNQTNLTGQVST